MRRTSVERSEGDAGGAPRKTTDHTGDLGKTGVWDREAVADAGRAETFTFDQNTIRQRPIDLRPNRRHLGDELFEDGLARGRDQIRDDEIFRQKVDDLH